MDQVIVDGLTVSKDKSHFKAIVRGIQAYQRGLSTFSGQRQTPLVNSDARYPAPLQVLSFDGAAYAPLALRILDRLEDKYPGFLERTSVFCGTSDGALVSLALSFYLQRGDSGKRAIRNAIEFENNVIACLSPSARDWFRFFSGHRPLYGRKFKRLLEDTFGKGTLLAYLQDRPVSLAAFDATKQRPCTFTCFGPQAANKDLTIVGAAMAVCSLPFLMPLSHAPEPGDGPWDRPAKGNIILDGGMANNDPAMMGLSDVLLGLCDGQEDLFWTARRFLPYLRVLSFGARPPAWKGQRGGAKSLRWGWLKLFREVGPYKILDLLVGGPSADNQGICKQLIGVHRFMRFESPLSLTETLVQVMGRPRGLACLLAQYDHRADEAWNQALECAGQEPPDDEFPVLPNWVNRYWMQDWSSEQKKHW